MQHKGKAQRIHDALKAAGPSGLSVTEIIEAVYSNHKLDELDSPVASAQNHIRHLRKQGVAIIGEYRYRLAPRRVG